MLIEETNVPTAQLPIAEFRDHLRLGSGFSDDTLQDVVLESFLRAALAAIEARTGKAVLQRDFSWRLSEWRNKTGQAFPVAPVQDVASVVLRDSGGAEAMIASSAYRLQGDIHFPRLMPVGACLPQIPNGGQVQINFTAGIASAWVDIPADLAQAVLMLSAHFYEYRHETALGRGCMPFGVTSLLERYRTMRIGQGDPL